MKSTTSSRGPLLLALALSATLSLTPSWADAADDDEGGAPPAGFQPPRGEILLRDALAASLLGNPELSVFSAETRAREARALQAGLLPNPELDAEVEDFAGSGARDGFQAAQTTLRLSQLLELGGKRAKRREAALLERDLAGWDFEAKRATVLTETTRAFIGALSSQQRLALARDLVGIASESLRAVDASIRAGASSPVERLRARVVVAEAKARERLLERELRSSYHALAGSWGSTDVTFSAVRGDLEQLEAPLPLEALLQGVAANPDLARWATEIQAREAQLSLARAGRIPDVRVGAGPRYYSDDDSAAAVVELSVPLPLFDRRQGEIGEATQRLSKTRFERASADVSIRSALARDYEALRAAYEHALSLRDTILPDAREAYDAAGAAYAQGALRYVDVLDAQRTLFDLRDQYVESLADYQRALADVERLAGGATRPTLDPGAKP